MTMLKRTPEPPAAMRLCVCVCVCVCACVCVAVMWKWTAAPAVTWYADSCSKITFSSTTTPTTGSAPSAAGKVTVDCRLLLVPRRLHHAAAVRVARRRERPARPGVARSL